MTLHYLILNKEICLTLESLLDNDSNSIIKKSIAEVALSLWNWSEEETSKEIYLPIINKVFTNLFTLMSEKGLGNQEDRAISMVLISNLGVLSKIIDISKYNEALISCWKEMMEVSDWRERSKFLQEFPRIAEVLGRDMFNSMFLDLVKESLSDTVASVRKQAIAVINKLASIFGVDWSL